jgi:hypothetical protein
LCIDAVGHEPVEYAGKGTVHGFAKHCPEVVKEPALHEYIPKEL